MLSYIDSRQLLLSSPPSLDKAAHFSTIVGVLRWKCIEEEEVEGSFFFYLKKMVVTGNENNLGADQSLLL